MPSRTTPPIVIKRYGRSRLYDAENTRYVTIEQLRSWRLAKRPFIVVDSETGADVTKVLLT